MADKSVTIKNATDKQLDEVINRLRKENEAQMLVFDLKRRSLTEFTPYDAALGISTETPIEDLYHYGVPGMKWGRRLNRARMRSAIKRQTKDAERLEKLGWKEEAAAVRGNVNKLKKKHNESMKKDYPKDNISEDRKRKDQLKKKKLTELTNAELKTLNERMQLEKQYKELARSEMSPGKRFVSDVLQGAAKQTAINFTSKAMTSEVEKIFNTTAPKKKNIFPSD